ncbi:hypothetical protein TCE0_015r02749 [Talaromyces pinophilus]|uniref:Uncharacterized protein n=1 Tax=Talaromyces pinophilus TaxID=128442 RepID=A0A6V8H218_TALPI|nr:hypothetical protein TCE0_015r02749 [Talaromyces pinophilus]
MVAEAVAAMEVMAIVVEPCFVEAVVLVERDPLKGWTAAEAVGNIVEGLNVVTEVEVVMEEDPTKEETVVEAVENIVEEPNVVIVVVESTIFPIETLRLPCLFLFGRIFLSTVFVLLEAITSRLIIIKAKIILFPICILVMVSFNQIINRSFGFLLSVGKLDVEMDQGFQILC